MIDTILRYAWEGDVDTALVLATASGHGFPMAWEKRVNIHAKDDDQSRSNEEDEMKPPPFLEMSPEFGPKAWPCSFVTDLLDMALRTTLHFLHSCSMITIQSLSVFGITRI